jgi:hypothetical protein
MRFMMWGGVQEEYAEMIKKMAGGGLRIVSKNFLSLKLILKDENHLRSWLTMF